MFAKIRSVVVKTVSIEMAPKRLSQSETRLWGERLGVVQLTANKGPKTSLLLSPGATLQAHGGSGNGSEHPLINGLV